MDKKNLGLFSLIGTIASILIMLIINSTFGLIVYILSIVLAIVDLVMAYSQPKTLYLTSLKSFGKKNGTEVYRKINNFNVSA